MTGLAQYNLYYANRIYSDCVPQQKASLRCSTQTGSPTGLHWTLRIPVCAGPRFHMTLGRCPSRSRSWSDLCLDPTAMWCLRRLEPERTSTMTLTYSIVAWCIIIMKRKWEFMCPHNLRVLLFAQVGDNKADSFYRHCHSIKKKSKHWLLQFSARLLFIHFSSCHQSFTFRQCGSCKGTCLSNSLPDSAVSRSLPL